MFGKKKPEVLVVGAGPVGLFAALALVKKGIQVMIVDKEWRTGAHSYALALHPRSLKLLEELGLLTGILEQSYHVHTIGLYDGTTRRAEMRMTGQEEQPLPLAVMRQDVLEHVLEEALDREGVKVLWNHAVSGLDVQQDKVVATVDKMVKESVGYAVARTEWMIAKSYDVEASMVIGADGHHSFVRRSLGIDFPDLGGTQHFAVFECESDADLGHEMRINLGPQTTDVLWPLAEGRCRWSFQQLESAAPESTRTKHRIPVEIGGARFPLLDEGTLSTLIAERAPWFEGKVEKVNWRIVVRFERRLAEAFGRKRVWLAGDAGHLTGPVGMQSMNIGLREAHELVDLMTGVLRENASDEQLREYGRQRLAQWRFLLGLEGGLTAEDVTDPWVRQVSERLLPCFPASASELAALAQQLSLKATIAD
jgi:2-polyprenyl-6-methoxyphenol hydroxylase-like FAD-dependent oxidoreductase